MTSEHKNNGKLYLHSGHASIVVLGEVLWDVFETSQRLGGAALNFAAHAKRLGHAVSLLSAVGTDTLGEEAWAAITDLGLSSPFLQMTSRFPTGTASVKVGPGDRTRFSIERPAAYDALSLTEENIALLARSRPGWLYYGTLFPSTDAGKATLRRLLDALPAATRFYDLNIRPGSDSETLVTELLGLADVVKLNEEEMFLVQQCTGLPISREAFCREGAKRYGWKAVCVTLGAHGCALLSGEEYIEANGYAVDVADTVGAGDAFAASFVHGLILKWPAAQIAAFANRVAALVASRHGAIPNWSIKEAVEL